MWSAVSPLTISESLSSAEAEIRLQYSTLRHGDCGFPFDSEGGVLAHAFYPHSGQLAGDVHFDDDETWSHDARQGIHARAVEVLYCSWTTVCCGIHERSEHFPQYRQWCNLT